MLNLKLGKNAREDGSNELPFQNERGKGHRRVVEPASNWNGFLRF